MYLIQTIWPNSAFDFTQSLIFTGYSKFVEARSLMEAVFESNSLTNFAIKLYFVLSPMEMVDRSKLGA